MFIRDIFHSIVEVTLVAKTPSYESIMEVDRKMREAICDYPYSTEIAIDPAHPDYHCATASLRDYCQSQCRSICEPLLLLSLRRPNAPGSHAVPASQFLCGGIYGRPRSRKKPPNPISAAVVPGGVQGIVHAHRRVRIAISALPGVCDTAVAPSHARCVCVGAS